MKKSDIKGIKINVGAEIMAISLSDFLTNVQSNQNTYTTSYKKKVREANTEVQDFQESLTDFRKKVRNLKDYDSDNVIKDHVKKQLEEMVSSYNSLLKSASSLEESGKNTRKLSKSMEKLEQLFGDNASTLRKLGIRKDKNVWKMNTDTFEDLEKNEVNKLCKKLFVGKNSFIDQVDKTIRKAKQYAQDSEYTTNIRQFHTLTKYDANEIGTAQGLSSMKSNLDAAASYVKNLDKMTDADSVACIKSYVSTYQHVISMSSTLESNYITAIKNFNKCDDVREQLSKIGISVDENGELTADNTETITKDDTFCNTLCTLFAEGATYANTMQTLCNNAIDEILKADKLGLSFNESI